MHSLLSAHFPWLLNIIQTLQVSQPLTTQLSLLSEAFGEKLQASSCLIFTHHKERNELWKRIQKGRGEIKITSNAHAPSLLKEEQMVLELYHDFLQNKPLSPVRVYDNIALAPLLAKDGFLVGVIVVQNAPQVPFSGEPLALLELIAAALTTPLENALLYHKVRTSQAKIINKLSEAAEFKDDEASTHTKRIGLYAEAMASNLGLDEHFTNLIKLTAPMHDIGKIGIAEEIIQKAGPLSEEEFASMKQHTLIGYTLLADPEDEALTMAANIARDHHEKFGGGGYPYGKKGEEITLEGRIVAVADVFDVLTSKRPYKAAWSIERAFEFIESLRGKHFDPDVTDAFLKNQEEIHFIRVSFED